MDKVELRKIFQRTRAGIPRHELVTKSTEVAQNTQCLVNWHTVQSVHMYRAHRKLGEVETSWFESFLATIWPHIDVTVGSTDISAPIPTGAYDLILVPLLAFDATRTRLGYGGGWYDRFLNNQPEALTVGLALDVQEYEGLLPYEAHDIALDYIVTESRVIT